LLRQGKKPAELVELGFPKRVVTRVRRRLRAVTSGRTDGKGLKKVQQPPESPHTDHKVSEETAETVNVPETNISLSRRLNNLEKAICDLAASYAFNEAAKEKEQTARSIPPCPECLKKGDRGFIWAVRRKTSPKDLSEFIQSIEDAEELNEEEKEELLEPVPTHVIEAKCQKCGYTKFIGYDWQ
jgi:hypothetical protein